MKVFVLALVCMFSCVLSNAQTIEYLGTESAFQTSEFIRAVPQKSNGFLIMHKNEAVDYWKIEVINADTIVNTYYTNVGENHLRLDAEVYNNVSNAYKIQGISNDGAIVVDIDLFPIDGIPEWVLNDCNRPTCVKTSGGSSYAYSMKVLDHINNYDNDPTNDNNAYKLRLARAYSHYDPSSGYWIPYYIEVNANSLTDALIQQGHYSGVPNNYPNTGIFTYFPDGNKFKVALGMGPWSQDLDATTSQINGIGGEGCMLTFATALNRMNASAALSTPLICNGQYSSNNEPSGGDSPYGTAAYADASTDILNCSALFSDTTYTIDYSFEEVVNEDGLVSYVVVFNLEGVNITLNCDEEPPTSNPNSPCPIGYVYSPGGGDPCIPIQPILDKLKTVTVNPIDVNPQGEETPEDVINPGLYLVVLNYGDGISIPVYKKIEERISLNNTHHRNNNSLTAYPNPTKDKITLKVNEDEHILSYTIVDSMGNTVAVGDFSSKSNEQHIDVKGLRPGVFFLNVKTNIQSYTEKLIKK